MYMGITLGASTVADSTLCWKMANRGRSRRSLASQPVFSLRGRSRGASSTNASGSDTQRRPGSSENSRPDVSTAVVKPTPTPVEGQFTDVQLEGAKTRKYGFSIDRRILILFLVSFTVRGSHKILAILSVLCSLSPGAPRGVPGEGLSVCV